MGVCVRKNTNFLHKGKCFCLANPLSQNFWFNQSKYVDSGAVVVTQLVERLLPIPEVRGLIPVIGKNLHWTLNCQLYLKDENKEKEAANGPFIK